MPVPPPLIFLGPSLPRPEAEALCPGEYHGPVARGELPALAGDTPRTVVIVDGRFERTRAVSPKEILAALDHGHVVYGATSMGALRAVEMERFGMHGVGRIFRAFRRGVLTADDEVAVAFDPQTYRPLSEPLAGVRVGLREAVRIRLLSREAAAELVSIAAGLHYPQRTLPRILSEGGYTGDRARGLLRFLEHEATDPKAEDTRTLLRRISVRASTARVPRSRIAGDLPIRPRTPGGGPALHQFPPSPKVGPWDSVRTTLVAETECRLSRVRRTAGITRVAEVTGLDVLSVPSFIAVRPSRDPDCISVYSGKALRPDDARVGAQMEALEMACALDDRVAFECTSYQRLHETGRRAVHPDALIPLFDAPSDLARQTFDWVSGWDLLTGAAVMVPANAVFFRRRPQPLFWKISSNGLASGNTLAEAIAHGLAEVIERDAETMFRLETEYARFPGMLRAVAGPPRTPSPPSVVPPPRDFPFIRLDSLPEPLAEIVTRIRRRQVRVALRRITSDVAVPTLLCVLWERTDDARQHLVQYGCGTHPDPQIAARRAITEAAQSRVTAIQGAREDLEAGAITPSAPPEHWFDGGTEGIDFRDLPAACHADVRDDIAFMIDRLAEVGLHQVLAVDLSIPALQFPVVKVLVPGLELAFHAVDLERITFGWRARRYFDDALTGRPAPWPTGRLTERVSASMS